VVWEFSSAYVIDGATAGRSFSVFQKFCLAIFSGARTNLALFERVPRVRDIVAVQRQGTR